MFVKGLKLKLKENDESMLKLSNEDRLIILVTKGHYSQYKNPIQFLIGKVYALELKYVDEHKIQNYLMKIYSRLVDKGYIYLGDNPVYELLQKINEIGRRPLAPKSLYDMLYGSISIVKAKGLDLDEVDDSIMRECELKEVI